MSGAALTVVIPVGPLPHHRRWLDEALDSVEAQTVSCRTLIVDDMSSLPQGRWYRKAMVHRNLWRLGVGASFNIGVNLAYGWALMLGADDWLAPNAVEECVNARQAQPESTRKMGYYYLPLQYEGNWQEVAHHPRQHVPCNAAMVHTKLWRETGGFPLEGGVGAPDAALISILQAHNIGKLIPVGGPKPLYFHRVHEGQDTRRTGRDNDIIITLRERLTRDWTPPQWGRQQ